jgi:hypothetical protein
MVVIDKIGETGLQEKIAASCHPRDQVAFFVKVEPEPPH